MTITPPPKPKQELIDGLLDEYREHAKLIRNLGPDGWTAPTRCAGWQVRDVFGHVTGLASDSFNGRIGQSTADEQAAQRRDKQPADVAAELEEIVALAGPLLSAVSDEQWEGPSGAPDLTLGEGIETLWFDAWVHRDDVHAALGRPRPDGDAGLDVSARHARLLLERRGWAPPAGVDIDAIHPYEFVLAATGRLPAADVGLDDEVNLYR